MIEVFTFKRGKHCEHNLHWNETLELKHTKILQDDFFEKALPKHRIEKTQSRDIVIKKDHYKTEALKPESIPTLVDIVIPSECSQEN